MVTDNVVLDRGPMGREHLGSETPVRSDAAYCQISFAFVIIAAMN